MERIEKRIAVVVIGLPGRASSMVAEAVTRQRDMKLLGFTLGNYAERFKINGMEIVQLEPYLHRRKLAEERPDVVVDLTPRRETARFRYNVELCSECGIFVIAGDNRSGVVRKLRVSAATIPDVF